MKLEINVRDRQMTVAVTSNRTYDLDDTRELVRNVRSVTSGDNPFRFWRDSKDEPSTINGAFLDGLRDIMIC